MHFQFLGGRLLGLLTVSPVMGNCYSRDPDEVDRRRE